MFIIGCFMGIGDDAIRKQKVLLNKQGIKRYSFVGGMLTLAFLLGQIVDKTLK